MAKIKSNMKLVDIIVEISDGNPGAINVMCALFEYNKDTNKHGDILPLATLLALDLLGIYGSKIYILFEKVCNSDFDVFQREIAKAMSNNEAKKRLFMAIENRTSL